jgi:hypothetical protein
MNNLLRKLERQLAWLKFGETIFYGLAAVMAVLLIIKG